MLQDILKVATEETVISLRISNLALPEIQDLVSKYNKQEHLTVSQYREVLSQASETYPYLDRVVIECTKLETPYGAVRDVIREVQNALGIQEGQIVYSPLGRITDGEQILTLEDIANQLIRDAVCRNPRKAAIRFQERIDGGPAPVEIYFIAAGIRPEHEMQIAPGVAILHISNDNKFLLPVDLQNEVVRDMNLLTGNAGIIRVRRTVTLSYKIVGEGDRENIEWPNGFDVTVHGGADEAYPEDDLMRLMSLYLGFPVVPLRFEIHTGEQVEPFHKFRFVSSSGRVILDAVRAIGAVTFMEEYAANFHSLYTDAMQTSEMLDSIRIPTRQWIKSMTAVRAEEKAIHMGVAMETLFTRGTRDELSYRMGVRAAKMLGQTLEERESIRKTVTEAYNTRSRAVHDGNLLKGIDSHRERINAGQEVVLKVLRAIVASGKFPSDEDWRRIDIE